MQSASDTPSSHSRRGWRSPSGAAAATSWRSRPRSGAHRGSKGLSPRSESVRLQEHPDGFTSDTRHSDLTELAQNPELLARVNAH